LSLAMASGPWDAQPGVAATAGTRRKPMPHTARLGGQLQYWPGRYGVVVVRHRYQNRQLGPGGYSRWAGPDPYCWPVETLPCGHVALEGARRLCRHLLGEGAGELDTFWVLRGVGVEYDLCCGRCASAGPDRELVVACEGCVDRADERWSVVGVIGEPEIRRSGAGRSR